MRYATGASQTDVLQMPVDVAHAQDTADIEWF